MRQRTDDSEPAGNTRYRLASVGMEPPADCGLGDGSQTTPLHHIAEHPMPFNKPLAKAALAALATLPVSLPAAALTLLGGAQNFAVLGASAIKNTGPTRIHGDIAVAPGTAISGSSTIALIGTLQGAPAPQQAQNDARSA